MVGATGFERTTFRSRTGRYQAEPRPDIFVPDISSGRSICPEPSVVATVSECFRRFWDAGSNWVAIWGRCACPRRAGEPADVVGDGAPPGNGEGQEQRVEA
jgi:hypothetical protein